MAPTEAQQPLWLREFGAFGDDWANALVAAESGELYVTGGTMSSLFGAGLGSSDAFLARFDSAGNLLDGAQFGTNLTDSAFALAPTGNGEVYVGGWTNGNFGGPNAGGWDAWLARCDSAGNPLWVRQLGSPDWEWVEAVASDGNGRVFVAGITYGDLAGSSGGSDVWLARYDGAGRRLWLLQFGTTNSDYPTGLVPDGAGGFFACGSTSGNLAGQQLGDGDAWIARYDWSGNQLWARQFGTIANDTGRALGANGSGGVFFAGSTRGMLVAPNAGDADIWVAGYDVLGNQLSIVQFGSIGADWADGVAADGLGGAFVAGSTNAALGASYAGETDAWIAHIQGGVTVDWIDQLGTPLYDAAAALAPAGPGRVFVAGSTLGSLASGGGGNEDAWLARYDLCYPDCNADGVLTVPDFGCFQTRFLTADPYADCNADGVLTVADFGCFQTKFVTGCP